MSRQMTLGRFGFKKSISHRNSVMETKVPDFVSTMSRTIKCNHCSKLFVNQQGLSVHEKCVHGVFTDVSTDKIISILFKISSSALFLKYSSNFANFGLDILIKYILIKKECISDVWDLVESSRSNKRKDGSSVIKNLQKPIYNFSILKVMIVSTYKRAYSIFLALA